MAEAFQGIPGVSGSFSVFQWFPGAFQGYSIGFQRHFNDITVGLREFLGRFMAFHGVSGAFQSCSTGLREVSSALHEVAKGCKSVPGVSQMISNGFRSVFIRL